MSEPFLTIAKNTSNEMVIKKSRFICSIARVTSDEAAQQFINQISTENRKATHNCYAYMVGDRDQIQRESDNGEPSGTAGVPILESLQLAKLHNVVAVATRYFGGIKLGAGGLIRAYSNSTTNAIHKAGLVQLVTQAILEITVSYAQHDSLLHYLKEYKIEVADEQFSATVQTNVYVDEDKVDTFTKLLIDRFNDQLTIKKGTSREHEIPYLTD